MLSLIDKYFNIEMIEHEYTIISINNENNHKTEQSIQTENICKIEQTEQSTQTENICKIEQSTQTENICKIEQSTQTEQIEQSTQTEIIKENIALNKYKEDNIILKIKNSKLENDYKELIVLISSFIKIDNFNKDIDINNIKEKLALLVNRQVRKHNIFPFINILHNYSK
jgi:hypothetical protein